MEKSKLKVLIASRAIIAYFLLSTFLFYKHQYSIFPYPTLLFVLIVSIFSLTIIYILVLTIIKKSLSTFAYTQHIIDIFLIVFFILITGGIGSWFSFLLLVNVIVAGIIIGKGANFFIASLSSIIYAIAIEFQHYGVIPISYDILLQPEDFVYNIFANVIALMLISFLSNFLIIRTEKTSKKLIKMEIDLKEKEKLAAIGELSANIAHEIRNPLAAIKSSVEMLREAYQYDEKNSRLMNIAIKEMNRLNSIITNVLIYSNPKPLEFKNISISDIINETLDMLNESYSNDNNIMLLRDYKDNIYIDADEDKLRQVIWNITVNALQSLENGGAVTVSVEETDNHIKMIFKDNGIGMGTEVIRKIFHPFFTTRSNGTGLGLAMAHRIVEEHNGSIQVSTAKNEGSIFEVLLPKRQIT